MNNAVKFLFLLQLVIVVVWITAGLYSIPKFIFVRTITNDLGNGQEETICIAHRKAYNSELFDLINFALLYVLPLLVMTVSIINYIPPLAYIIEIFLVCVHFSLSFFSVHSFFVFRFSTAELQ